MSIPVSMSLSAVGVVGAVNECVTLFQWAKSAIPSLYSRWSGSQEQILQDHVLQLESGLQRLRDTLPAMYDLVNKAEWRSHEHVVAKLLPNLKDAVAEAEDLLDEFGWYEKKVQVEGNASQSSFIDFFHTAVQGSFNKLNDVQLRLNHLSSQLENMGLRGVTRCFDKIVRPETTSFPNETKIFGRDKELKRLLGFLNVPAISKRKRATSLASTSASNHVGNQSRILGLHVLPIVGIGGVGKTTLAQHICSHRRVKSHFDMIIWICVSDDFDVKRLTKEVIQSCTRNEAKTDNLDSLQRDLSNHVNNKRLLIVLDDMWDDALKENGQCWKRFCAPFRSAQHGSVMLVTTRCPNVTEGVRTMEPIIVEGLKDDVFWNFFKLCAFGSEGSNNDPELESIGRSILAKLKGSPLAAKTLGRMLSMDLQASHWNSILESELWELKQEETDILPALRLSYMYLPLYLKQCFAFCAVYPKDYRFHKARLAEIWVAEGFVDPRCGVPIQDIGCQYFEDLVKRSFFQIISSRYVIHDLLHDMAQMVSKQDCCILRNRSDLDKVPQNVRHLYVLPSSEFDDSSLLKLCNYTKLRTLICKKDLKRKTGFVMGEWCTKLLCMRVISCDSTNELPDNIGNWKHLRYLEINKARPLKKIPSTFCWLYHLQILYAKNCRLECLPDDFGKLISLQKFESVGLTYYDGCRMYLGPDNKWRKITLMKNLNQFRGHLELIDVHLLSKDHAAELNLKNKKYLDELKLNMREDRPTGFPESDIEFDIDNNDVEVLEVLQPPISLKSLFLQNYDDSWLPSWFQPHNLPRLTSLTVVHCFQLESISPPASLEKLVINDCPNLVSIGGAKALARIKTVEISMCPKLKEAEQINTISHLRDWRHRR
ncbi:putative disease resistance RPP13-like protein 1 [Aegilops tauschii subsp. strangulata]|uniref:putative disease resistance RPP13-like protein 1 n=1 Tax=Aegilops tauschii subsp. strangulata TaxID=200361 RepID=UPI00098AD4A8